MKPSSIYLHNIKNNDFENVCNCQFYIDNVLDIKIITKECLRCKKKETIDNDFVTKEDCGCEYIYDSLTNFRYYLKECDKHQ